MTHQLVRHRLMSVSQQSQRYVEEESFRYVVPESIAPQDRDEYRRDMEIIRQMYQKWRQKGLLREDARFVLPNACTSEIVVSANFREWRHILHLRTSKKAQWEIRNACLQILEILKQKAPDFHKPITAYLLPLTSYLLLFTFHLSPTTDYRLPLTTLSPTPQSNKSHTK